MSELRARATVGVLWNVASVGSGAVLQIVQLVVLARLLAPSDFGLTGMAMLVVGAAQMFNDLGVSAAIVQRKDTSREQLSSLYWLTIAAGLILAVIVAGSAPVVAWLFREPRLLPLMPWTALLFVVTPIGQQFQLLAQRDLRFRRLALIDIFSSVVGTALAIAAALGGAGVLALVWGPLAGVALKAVALAIPGWAESRPLLRFRRSDLAGFISFGLYQLGERTTNYLISRIDQILVGGLLGATQLGYYNFALNLVTVPIWRLSGILTSVAFPVFAKVHHEVDRLRRGYMELVLAIMLISSPILFGTAAIAPVLLPVVFGAKWLPAVTLLQILSLVMLFRSHGNPIGALLLARGRADLGFWWCLGVVLAQIPAVIVGARLGDALGVAWSLVGMLAVFSIFNYRVLVRRLLGPCLRSYLAAIAPGVLGGAAMGLAVRVARGAFGQPNLTNLLLLVAVGVASYGLFAVAFLPDRLRRLRDDVFRRGSAEA
jgi:lipopolysaccharide exporter